MTILIGADIVPTERNIEYFIHGDDDSCYSLFGEELFDLLINADFRIFNIEAPITNSVSPITKCGPCLRIPPACIKGFNAMKIDMVTLANNHILDQGIKGIKDTTDYLDRAQIAYVGAGDNLRSASEPFISKIKNIKFGIYACTEHEFSIAKNNYPGANPYDPLYSFDKVEKTKTECDYLIVLYHGGKEYYRYPSPVLQRTCRRFVEKGADLVICQHSHCVGCEENYNGGKIVYGQGNFLFDRFDDEYWNSGLLIEIEDFQRIKYIPLRKHEMGVRLADCTDAEAIINAFYERSKEIQKNGFVDNKYREFAQQKLIAYLRTCYPVNDSIIARIMNKLTHGKYLSDRVRKAFNTKRLVQLYNYIECEAHRELFTTGLECDINLSMVPEKERLSPDETDRKIKKGIL